MVVITVKTVDKVVKNDFPCVYDEGGVHVSLPENTLITNDVKDGCSQPAEWYYTTANKTYIVDAHTGHMHI